MLKLEKEIQENNKQEEANPKEILNHKYVIKSNELIKDGDHFVGVYGDGFVKIMKNRMDAFGNYFNWNGYTNSNNGKQTYHKIEYV